MPISDKNLGNAFRGLAEQINAIHESVSKLAAGLAAVKTVLAVHMSPADPLQASKHIETLEENFLKLDPNAAARKKFSEVIEMLKMIDKHGGPKQA